MDNKKDLEEMIENALRTLTKAQEEPNKSEFFLRAMIHLAIKQLTEKWR